MRVRRRRLALLLAAIAAACAAGPAARAEDAASLDAMVTAAERDAAQLPAARKAVDAAVFADPKAAPPRLLAARLSLAEAAAAKTDKRGYYEAALAALAVATQATPRDAAPYELKIKVLTTMSGPAAELQEALRAFAIRRPDDTVAREAYKRQTGKVPPLRVGDPLPPVVWKDAKGADFPAANLHADGKSVVLELYRSATWCTYCAKRLGELHDAYEEIKAEGAEVFAASPDTVETIAKIEAEGLKAPGGVRKPFRLKVLSDPKGNAADGLGVLNAETVTPGTSAERFGLPFPTTIVVDRDGFVVFVDTHSDFKDRTKIPEIVAAVKRAARK
jgi:peroxiredoxin